MKTLPPGSTIGILGGGQLGRMIALAAAPLGYHVHIFCGDAGEPAVEVSKAATVGSFSDLQALEAFGRSVDVVTLEWENVPLEALLALEKIVPVRPGHALLRISQDRRLEKQAAHEAGIGTAPTQAVTSLAELEAAFAALGAPALLKTARMGYDGKGQVFLKEDSADLAAAWEAVKGQPCVLEGFVDFMCEVSVLVARREDGASVTYPVVRNVHRNQILFETHAPSALPLAVEEEARALALRFAERLGLIGLMAVEMFVLKEPNEAGQRVLMNEIAPRPHNSGHWTIDACACSQFEQVVRSVCGLPLGSTVPHSQAVMRNLLGDEMLDWPSYLANPKACLHLYGKAESRPGRKMGHVTLLGERW